MQIPVYIIENILDHEGLVIMGDDGEPLKYKRDLILLHWGLKEAYFPVLPENKVLIPMSVTIGICRDPNTGQTLNVLSELIWWYVDKD